MNRKERRLQAKQRKKKGAASPPQMSEKTISMLEQALEHQNGGQLDQAAVIYRQVLLVKPNNSFANHHLGVIHLHMGDTQSALNLIETAVKYDPSNPKILNNLGIVLDRLMRLDEAISNYRQALKLSPDFPEALNNLGCVLAKLGEEEEPETCFRRVLELNPNNIDGLNNLGNLLMVDGRYDEAKNSYRKALEMAPENAEFHNNLGSALQFLERIEDAQQCFRRALEIRPNFVEALCKLANAQKSGGFAKQAIETFGKASKLEPENIGIKASSAIVLPIIPASVDEIDHYRARMLEQLDAIQNSAAMLPDPVKDAGVTGFYLAYHNENDVEHVKKLAGMYLDKCPSLASGAETLTNRQNTNAKYRIGFLSYHFYDHTIGKLYKGFIEHLDRELFEVILFSTSRKTDAMAVALESHADKVVHLRTNLESARQDVGNKKLDLLFYPDVGMDAFTYFLAFSRLAPVQVTSWGHPVSTGIPNIDYYISSRDLEVDTGDEHYSETLARLNNPPTYYYRPEIPKGTTTPSAHGLPADAHIYLCPQTLFKFHPNFDAILGEILENDRLGHLLLISGRYKSKETLLLERFKKTFPDVIDRVRFLPRMQKDDFLRVIQMSHVVLDPICFSGGNSTAETLAMGVPIVTWPDKYLRDRVTYSFFKTMGIDELIANSAKDYVALANRLANDKEFHAEMSGLISHRAGKFFENMDTVRELERFMIAAIEAEQKGDGHISWNEP